MPCLPRLPIQPVQASYSVEFADGVLSSSLDGGPSFRRLDTSGNPFTVNVTWALWCGDYNMLMGYVRNWMRSGGDPFLIDMPIESETAEEYQATFIPGTIRLASKDGPLFIVTAQLEALPNFVDPCTDGWGASALLHAYFGDDVCVIAQNLAEATLEDLVYRGT